MNSKQVTDHILQQYAKLETAVSAHSVEAGRLLERCFAAAIEREKDHRRYCPGKCRQSVQIAAKYFAIKWFKETPRDVSSCLEASRLRLDILYAGALRLYLGSYHPVVFDITLGDINYTDHIGE